MSQRLVYDCDRCGKKDIGSECRVRTDIDLDGSGNYREVTLDFCYSCLTAIVRENDLSEEVK